MAQQKKSKSPRMPSTFPRVTDGKTDKNGQLKPKKKLDPSTKYVICKEVPVGPAKSIESRQKIVDWIDGCVLGDLRTMVVGMEERKEKNTKGEAESPALGGGNFFLSAGCCMALEYFGQVYGKGKNATESVQKYVEKFLKPIDARYMKAWPIIWRSFRNGIVHGSWPQVICMEGFEERVAIGADNDPDGDHFRPASNYQGKSFAISSYRFFQDIERSFHEGFRDWILQDPDNGILERAAPRLLEIRGGNSEGKKAFKYVLGLNT
jgi:hypothetical protein